jgi:hypothetical protein
MKKFFFSIILSLLFSAFAHAQWTTQNGYTFATNPIGIGTMTPAAKLQVFASATQYTNIDGSAISLVSSNAATPLLSLTGSSTADLLNLTNGSNSLIVKSTGNVGLGTKNNILLSNGIMSIESGAAAGINNGLTLNSAHDYGSGAGTAASALSFTRNRTGDISAVSYNAQISGGNTSETTSQGGYLAFSTSSDGLSLTEAMRIFKNGNIGIGTANPLNYKLGVNGSLIATSVTVKMYSDWGDYVFKKDYHLPLLSEVKTYIDKNHHLPEIPSAQQIAKEGLNLGEINKLLVKKVEELTLYLIEKDNKQKEQDNLLAQQQRQINELIQQVARLSKTNANK